MGEPTDRELWDAAVAGDSEAFGRLFERHARAVYNFAFRRTASWALAEGLTSEVFLLAWRRRRDVVFTTEEGRVLPWLLGVATNVIRNRHRSERRAAAAMVRLGAALVEADFSDDVLGRLADERDMARILGVVGRLPSPSRRCSRCAPGPGSATRTRRSRAAFPSGRSGRGSRAPAPTCGNYSSRTDMNRLR